MGPKVGVGVDVDVDVDASVNDAAVEVDEYGDDAEGDAAVGGVTMVMSVGSDVGADVDEEDDEVDSVSPCAFDLIVLYLLSMSVCGAHCPST